MASHASWKNDRSIEGCRTVGSLRVGKRPEKSSKPKAMLMMKATAVKDQLAV